MVTKLDLVLGIIRTGDESLSDLVALRREILDMIDLPGHRIQPPPDASVDQNFIRNLSIKNRLYASKKHQKK